MNNLFNMFGINPLINNENEHEHHPQENILKYHTKRSVHELLLESIKSNNINILKIFNNENEIEIFKDNIIKYWEEIEEYEICAEVIESFKVFVSEWKALDLTIVTPLDTFKQFILRNINGEDDNSEKE